MNQLLEQYLNFPRLVLDQYKNLGLDETDAIIIMHIHHLLNSGATVITPDVIGRKMSVSATEIDRKMAALLDKGFLSLEQDKKNFSFSLQGVIAKMTQNLSQNSNDNLYSMFEKEFGRPLSSTEVQVINDWRESNFSEEEIIAAWCKAVANNKATIKYTDGILNQK